MQRLIILICALFLASCSKVEMATNVIPINLEKTPTVSPTIQENIWLKPVMSNVKLNTKQKKYLNESLPPKVREILEKAETFEILAEVRGENEDDGEGQTFDANRIVKNINETDKKETLEAFYFDASREDSPAFCYEPRHSIKATYRGKTVEIEICFSCSKFTVKSEFGEFDGTIVRENRKSEDFFNQIVKNKSVGIK